MDKKFKVVFTIICILLQVCVYASEKSSSVVIVKSNWTSQIVLSEILKNIYTSIGIKSELNKLSVEKQWGAIARGNIDIQVEVWQGTMEKEFNRLIKSKKFILAGSHKATTREDWWYPKYVEKLCPGLPDWRALKNCSAIFKTNTSNGKGRYLGGPWEKPHKVRIRVLNLNFIIERVSKGDDLWIELEQAYKKQKPIILFN
jgi:glycine betaine/proline transport system substrate-binding protein